jgi:hypothetical protein
MNLHGLPAVVSSNFELELPAVFFALHLNVLADDLLVRADGGYEVPVRPETARTVVHAVEERELLAHLPRGVRFQDAYRGGDRHLRRQPDQEVNVVLVAVDLNHLNLRVAPLDGSHQYAEVRSHPALQHLPAVLGRKYEVVADMVDGVGLTAQQHPPTVAEDGGLLHPRPSGRGFTLEV